MIPEVSAVLLLGWGHKRLQYRFARRTAHPKWFWYLLAAYYLPTYLGTYLGSSLVSYKSSWADAMQA